LFDRITLHVAGLTSRLALLVLSLCSLLLAGCGYHLQGELTIPAEMRTTYIHAVDDYSLFHRELRLQFQAAGVQLTDSPVDATATFSILLDATDQRVLSVSARNVPTEYEVYYSVRYTLQSGEKILLEPQFVTVTRDYTYNESQVLGKAHEEDVLRAAIVDDLVRIVLKQISAL
jgi:LPS-assembly lipoprotein